LLSKGIWFLFHKWVKENLANIDSVTITGDKYGAYLGLDMLPRRIHCLTFDHVYFFMEHTSIKIAAEKLVLHGGVGNFTLDFIDDNCKTIAFHDCGIDTGISFF